MVRERYRVLLNDRQRGHFNSSGIEVEEEVDITRGHVAQGTVLRNYEGTHRGIVLVDRAVGPLEEDALGRPTEMTAFIVDPAGLFRSQASAAQVAGGAKVHRDRSGREQVRLKFLKSGSKLAEKGAFPLLYPYGDEHEPYEMVLYVANKGNRGRNANEGSSSGGGGGRGASRGETTNEKNVKMTWAENAKGRLYTDKILLNCGSLLQMWVLRTMTNIEDVRLQFLEREQRSRLVEERELIQGVEDDGNLAAPGSLYL